MEIKNITVGIITVLIASAVFASVLPAFADTTQAYDTLSNVPGSQGYFIEIGPTTESYTFGYSINNRDKCVVNDIEVNLFPGTLIAIKDIGLIRCKDDGGIGVRLNEEPTINAGVSNSLSLRITNGVLTFSIDGGETKTITLTDSGMAIAPAGPYVMTGSNQDIFIPDDFNFISIGMTNMSPTILDVFQITGTVTNMEVNCIIPPFGELNYATVENIQVNYTSVDKYNGVSKLTSITFDAVIDGSTTHCTYNRVIVPAEVTAERSIHPDTSLTIMLDILPLLIGCGLIIGAVGYFLTKKS